MVLSRLETCCLFTLAHKYSGRGSQHRSTHASNEREHITVAVSTNALFSLEPPQSRGTVHIYSIQNDPRNGYDEYFLQAPAKRRTYNPGTEMRKAIERCMTKQAPPQSWLDDQQQKAQSAQASRGEPPSSGLGNPGNAVSSDPVGHLQDGTPCYLSAASQIYFWVDRRGKPHSVKAEDVRLVTRTARHRAVPAVGPIHKGLRRISRVAHRITTRLRHGRIISTGRRRKAGP